MNSETVQDDNDILTIFFVCDVDVKEIVLLVS